MELQSKKQLQKYVFAEKYKILIHLPSTHYLKNCVVKKKKKKPTVFTQSFQKFPVDGLQTI